MVYSILTGTTLQIRVAKTVVGLNSGMETQRLMELGEKLGLSGNELREFIRSEQEMARTERQLERETARIAGEDARSEREAARVAAAEEANRQHERDMLKMQLEADKIREREANLSNSRVDTSRGARMSGHTPMMPPFRDDGKEDIDVYIQRFERFADNQGWDPEGYASYLGSLLSGEALLVYHRIPAPDAHNYIILKQALLKRYSKTPDDFRKKFYGGRQGADENAPQLICRLEHWLTQWISLSKVEKTFDGLQGLILQGQFLHACSPDLAVFIKEHMPCDLQKMVEWAEVFAFSRSDSRRREVNRKPTQNGKLHHNPPPPQAPRRFQDTNRVSSAAARCFICREIGHVANQCPTGRNRSQVQRQPMQQQHRPVSGNTGMCIDNSQHQCSYLDGKALLACGCGLPVVGSTGLDSITNLPLLEGTLDGIPVQILRDTGCNGVIVRTSLVNPTQMTGQTKVLVRIDRTSVVAPVAKCFICTPVYTGEVDALCLPDLVCDVVIGNIHGVHPEIMGDQHYKESCTPPELEFQKTEVTDNSMVGAAVETRAQIRQKERPTKPLKVALSEGLGATAEEFKVAQGEDDTLKPCFARAKDPHEDDKGNGWFEERDGFLFRHYTRKEDGSSLQQLVVPTKFRKEVLRLGHESVLAGHLGIKKTTDRILMSFFWPGVFGDIRRYCQSCDVCQRTVGKGTVQRAPVQPMPLVHTPFEKVAIDLIGPLSPPTSKGNRWILTLVDFSTRYPEAVALAKTDTETVAEALLSIFSRVGFPTEILSDNGPQFVSNVMNEVSRLASMRQIYSSPYHPQANGLCEKFNGTLKRMLRRMSAERPSDWDRYLEPLLFAYREAPQESTHFSPFELLYGRTVRGPMAILKELWSKEGTDREVTHTYQYVLDLRNRIEETCDLAHEFLQSAQTRYKKHFDRKARMRSLRIGEWALVLLPTENNKLLMQWQGPYEVRETVGLTDYRIRVGDKLRLFHINMLKRYTMREEVVSSMAAVLDPETCSELELHDLPNTKGETCQDVHLDQSLTCPEASELRALMEANEEIFTDTPGNTDLVTHDIKLTAARPIRVKPYPVPFSQTKVMEDEVRKMIDAGVVEPSCSPYCSPLLLVRKSDGTNRPVVDFRQLNKATVFDGEPMPDPETIFASLSGDKFFSKLDFTKGYWQINMTEEDKEKTAFSSSLGLLQFRRMPFGLVNAGATYSRMMRKLLDGLDGVANYVDDVIVHSRTWEEHTATLAELFARIRAASLTVKPSKCWLGYSKVDFLGHRVGEGNILTQDDKVEKLLKADRPRTKTQVRSLLGLAGYYRKYIQHYSSIVTPLINLTKKGQPNQVTWTDKAETAFRELKSKFCDMPILRLPDFERDFILRTDASDTGLGAILLQSYDGTDFPVAYASKKLSPAQTSYATVEKECLAIVWGLQKFHCYLYGRLFTIQTDHAPLAFLRTAKLSNPKLMRWALKLQPFAFKVEAISGKCNVGADYLSRID